MTHDETLVKVDIHSMFKIIYCQKMLKLNIDPIFLYCTELCFCLEIEYEVIPAGLEASLILEGVCHWYLGSWW